MEDGEIMPGFSVDCLMAAQRLSVAQLKAPTKKIFPQYLLLGQFLDFEARRAGHLYVSC